jgi:hypothetical protein
VCRPPSLRERSSEVTDCRSRRSHDRPRRPTTRREASITRRSACGHAHRLRRLGRGVIATESARSIVVPARAARSRTIRRRLRSGLACRSPPRGHGRCRRDSPARAPMPARTDRRGRQPEDPHFRLSRPDTHSGSPLLEHPIRDLGDAAPSSTSRTGSATSDASEERRTSSARASPREIWRVKRGSDITLGAPPTPHPGQGGAVGHATPRAAVRSTISVTSGRAHNRIGTKVVPVPGETCMTPPGVSYTPATTRARGCAKRILPPG